MYKLNKKSGYIIHKTENRYLLCKVLNEYNTQQEVNQALTEVLTGKRTEKELTKEYNNKPI